jgi:hypothetical protein
VQDLIAPYTGSWDVNLVEELFNSVDAGRILQIPINSQDFDDFVAWGANSHGRYSVKSGYYLQWKHRFGPRAGQLALPRSSILNLMLKILWKLKILSNVKIFIWRRYTEFYPQVCSSKLSYW